MRERSVWRDAEESRPRVGCVLTLVCPLEDLRTALKGAGGADCNLLYTLDTW